MDLRCSRVRNRLWFISTARHVSVDEKVADSLYTEGRPAIVDQYVRDALTGLTFQATSKNKLSFLLRADLEFKAHELNPGDEIEWASGLRDPKHALYYVGQVKWTWA